MNMSDNHQIDHGACVIGARPGSLHMAPEMALFDSMPAGRLESR